MCTVTFVPGKDGVYLTSNRDEWHTRGSALHPQVHHLTDEYSALFPRDKDAGGSWIAAKNNGDAAVLLNGAFKRHLMRAPYRKSRGLIFLEIIAAREPVRHFFTLNLEGIEPFTLIIYSQGILMECRWDGEHRHQQLLSDQHSHIWSSSTLYDEQATLQRKDWFHQWMDQQSSLPAVEDILHFHQTAGNSDPWNGLRINREEKTLTVSITSIRLSSTSIDMTYLDLKEDKSYKSSLDRLFKKQSAKKITHSRFRRFFIRLFNWEYWPFGVVYFPVYIYWMWLSLKARSFFFFSAANPLIKNSGFLLEQKKQIYDLMPSSTYPSTIFAREGISFQELKKHINEKKLSYPLIAKPDIGQRGIQVKLLKSDADLADYIQLSKVNFLVQEYIDYPNEVGIFYYRIPGESRGHISGIVGKEFLSIIGDGYSNMEELLLKDNRYVLQMPVLQTTYGKKLLEVLPAGTVFNLVPYGNHSRGAKFIDLSDQVNEALIQTIDRLCQSVPEFYYGRLDIKYKDWTSLCEGKEFSVIELNGAGSEPTHIYDPRHSIFFAWKTIIKHHHILQKISLLNARQKSIALMSTREGLKMFKENKAYLRQMA